MLNDKLLCEMHAQVLGRSKNWNVLPYRKMNEGYVITNNAHNEWFKKIVETIFLQHTSYALARMRNAETNYNLKKSFYSKMYFFTGLTEVYELHLTVNCFQLPKNGKPVSNMPFSHSQFCKAATTKIVWKTIFVSQKHGKW